MTTNSKTIVLILLLLSAGLWSVSAQERQWDERGEIEATEVVITKDRRIELPRANRNFEQVMPTKLIGARPTLSLQPVDLQIALPQIDPRIRVLTMKAEPIPKIYGNYLKGGLGNFGHSYFDGYFNNKRNKNYSYGARVYHNEFMSGAVDGRNSGAGQQSLSLFGKAMNPKVATSGSIGYQRNKVHLYGYQPWALIEDNTSDLGIEADSIRRIYHAVSVQTGIKNNNLKSDVDYQLQINSVFFFDGEGNNENDFVLDGGFDYQMSDDWNVTFDAQAYITQFKNDADEESLLRNLLVFRPAVSYRLNKLLIKGGLNFIYDSDSMAYANGIYLFPDIEASYPLLRGLEVKAGFKGDIERNNYRQFAYENPFIAHRQVLLNTVAPVKLYAEFKGSVGNVFGAKAGASLTNYRNMHFYIQGLDNPAAFAIIYDTARVTVANVYGEIDLKPLEGLHMNLKANYYAYEMGALDNHYHRPAYDVLLLSRYNISQKIIVKNNLWMVGGIPVVDMYRGGFGQEIVLDPFVRWDVGLEYLFQQRFSVFFDMNNILNQNYERWVHYPSRGMHFRLGLSYHF